MQFNCNVNVQSAFKDKRDGGSSGLEEQETEVVLDFQLIQEDSMWCIYTVSAERADVFFTSAKEAITWIRGMRPVRFGTDSYPIPDDEKTEHMNDAIGTA
ncbi:hypothetical protein Q7C36_020057 [Tachysurus vachellii]|uniref:Uncharacterized protein n=1 Tax=Tachysurus vachellii TaxID=175792 RepID=A0AA88RZ06_TACVA|nr:hypothetical protein Q7C36_020057 [Tachysurus vachellii]